MVEKLIKRYKGEEIKITETKGYIRLRVKDPKKFKSSTIRTHDIGRIGYTKRLAGRLKFSNERSTQAYLYNKKDFGRAEALRKAKILAEVVMLHRYGR